MGKFSDVLLTVDYDRTLTAPDSSIPERNLEAIRYFMENDGAFTVNTGRSVPMIQVFRDRVPVNAPLLLYNGSAAYDLATEKLLFCHEIQLDLWQTVRECMSLFPDLTVEVQGLDAHYRFTENPAWDAFSDHNQCAHGLARPGDDLGPFLKFTLYGEFRDVTVASMFDGTPEEVRRMDDAEAQLKARFGSCCEVFRAATRIIDVHAKGVSKIAPPGSFSSGWGGKFWFAWATRRTTFPCWRARTGASVRRTALWRIGSRMCVPVPTAPLRT